MRIKIIIVFYFFFPFIFKNISKIAKQKKIIDIISKLNVYYFHTYKGGVILLYLQNPSSKNFIIIIQIEQQSTPLGVTVCCYFRKQKVILITSYYNYSKYILISYKQDFKKKMSEDSSDKIQEQEFLQMQNFGFYDRQPFGFNTVKRPIFIIGLIFMIVLFGYLIFKPSDHPMYSKGFNHNIQGTPNLQSYVKIPHQPQQNFKIAIQVVLIVRENIPFLREWFLYHIKVGIDLFFLYDNSRERTDDIQRVNKYGINFDSIINHTDSEIKDEFQALLEQFKNYIVYVPWTPKNSNGQIIYGQDLSMIHYMVSYGHLSTYTLFIDIDEFLFSPTDLDLKLYLREKHSQNITRIHMHQKKFNDRFCQKDQRKKVSEIYDCINFDTHGWAEKAFIKNDAFNVSSPNPQALIHRVPNTYGESIKADPNDFRFNHYNLNRGQYQWMKGYFKLDKIQQCYDDSIKRYKTYLDKTCRQKCHDKHMKLNFKQGEQQGICQYKDLTFIPAQQ